MSFSISIAGHSSNPHNEEVKKAVAAALAELEKVEGISGSVSGYSWDNGGESNRVDLAQTFPRPVA
jgi:hypothetical protein